MTTSCIPRRTAWCSCPAPLFGGAPIEREAGGLAPTIIHASAASKVCGPASQRPCRAIAMPLPGLSIVAGAKRIGEPMAFIQAIATGAAAGYM